MASFPMHMAPPFPLLLSLLLLARGCFSQQCFSEADHGFDCGLLPQGLCFWQQGVLRLQSKTGVPSSDCVFVVRDLGFLDVLAPDSKLVVLARTEAHEGAVYYPDDDSLYFSSTVQMDPKPNSKLMKVFLSNGTVETVRAETDVANGMVLDKTGALLVLHQGVGSRGGFIERLNLSTLESQIVADNWFGHPFNSLNDAIVKNDGSVWFTDPDYGWTLGFRASPRLNNQVYRMSTSGVVDAVADGFVKPNGIAFSPDEKLLYVADSGSKLGYEAVVATNPHSITVFDVEENGSYLSNRRFFASVSSFDGSYEGVGCPDGLKVDTMGRVYTANHDGIQVWSPQGKVLGLIRVPGAINMGFGGPHRNKLLILNDTTILLVHLAAQGAGLHYLAQS